MKTEKQESAAHQFKNKLASIQAFAHLAIEEREGREAPRVNGLDYLQEIESLSRVMFSLLQQMLETMALEHDITLLKERRNVTEVARQIVAANQGQAAVKDIALLLTTMRPYYAEIDGNRMGEALDNLVSNAIKYSPPGRSVRVSVGTDHTRYVCIEVHDEGPGLSETDRTGLFEKYHRLSARPTGGESSTGLGLALAKRIVELHGGDLSAESKGPNQGSIFRIRIPQPTRSTVSAYTTVHSH